MNLKANQFHLEDFIKSDDLLIQISKFNHINQYNNIDINHLTINLSFKPTSFNKIKSIPFIFLLELITNQKPSLSKSSKNNIFLKIKEGKIVGCKITLRKKYLLYFLSYFTIILNNLDYNNEIFLKNFYKNDLKSFNFIFLEIFAFFQSQLEYNSNFEKLEFSVQGKFYDFESKIFYSSKSKLSFFK